MNKTTYSNPPCIRPLESVVRLLGRHWTIPLILMLGEQGSTIRYSEIREKSLRIQVM
ncbi:MAG: hypothetical protein ACE5H4_06940 [Candidatus Thorarchaeota archaeon]